MTEGYRVWFPVESYRLIVVEIPTLFSTIRLLLIDN